jgi:allophanate hydrolase subunit 2
MDLIGQLQPNMPTRFVPVDMAAALAARRERNARLEKLRHALA